MHSTSKDPLISPSDPMEIYLFRYPESYGEYIYIPGLRGAFHNNLLRFSGFVFHTKLVRTKTQRVIDKVSKHNGHTVFLNALVFRMHQHKWRQLFFTLHPLLITVAHNLRQLTFSLPPLPPIEFYATNRVRLHHQQSTPSHRFGRSCESIWLYLPPTAKRGQYYYIK